ncbi:MAG: hypothetical protein AUJ31_01140 [Parcubacteria group bacterium CG1_02_39_15]|uniref:Peptidase C39 domain-containing protein n=4 Tax=Bacteria candidate phyla TaxID=1783234 RepID=A0A2G9YSE6_9BACT|nr:MAG: hypothetical protein AUJ31_01140 [Parcubacteria group bacterium CG1_02_39_15]PIP22170.1 MAG: hypothetical protein COX38_02105 [Candidatus Nealsonbacteria bacterium CG23_combo_of_CG06-09_8_20_14_all_39_25]PIQ98318.1 MAG: hypothetical protein COV64_01985 [Candidatus Nealsonbacteria bacterium CG11_big_fil_rev_8_21_14_0_20_39_9]PIZ88308.1 MAG: hypothetical protein COX91_00800 [Candidatus Nealsonbacteria bacterium CG_4_10_14_0_2_um_filter_39_15]PJC68334.1 MAG: hypothetical protein CO015_0439
MRLKPFRQTPGLCGPASLKIIFDYYGVSVSETKIAKAAGATRGKGCSIKGLIKAAKYFGFKTYLKKKSSLDNLKYFVKKKVPVIVDWFFEDDGHYSVVADIDKNNITLIDPSLKRGIRKFSNEKFLRIWFDFPGKYIKDSKEVILRLVLVVVPKSFKY